MKRDRLSIHISDSAEIAVEERRNGIKRIKNISINDLLVCIKSSLREIKPVYHAVLPKNALFYSCCPETGNFSAAIEYPYSKATVTYMATEYPDFPLPKLVFGFKVNRDGKIQAVYLGVTENGILRENSKMFELLKQNSYYFKGLNRGVVDYKKFVSDMKVKYKERTSDKLESIMDNMELVSSVLNVLK